MSSTTRSGISGSLSHALLSDQVYDLIRGRLIAHEFEPGSRLVESDIARQLSVSQAPVREALRRLAHEGLVLQLPRRGSFVAEVSTQEARDAYEVRAALEPMAVKGALEHLSDELLAELDGHIQEMLAAADADDLPAFIDADVRFHRTVWTASGNELLPRVWLMVEASMRNLTRVSNRLYFSNLDEIARTHYPLLAGLRARDAEVATAFHEHVLRVWHLLLADEEAESDQNERS
jgi:DNA-binding GntR family transcriptional regulator